MPNYTFNKLLGGVKMTVTFETGETTELLVRQIPVRDYDVGFKSYSDEVALVAFLVGKPREFAFTITPESYEEILTAGREVNEKGFFASCRRRMEAEAAKEIQVATALGSLPAETLKTLTEQGAKLSSNSSSIPQPRRV